MGVNGEVEEKLRDVSCHKKPHGLQAWCFCKH